MHKPMKRLLALAALSLAAGAASAQSWPTQPVRWIVPYPAGGGSSVGGITYGAGKFVTVDAQGAVLTSP